MTDDRHVYDVVLLSMYVRSYEHTLNLSPVREHYPIRQNTGDSHSPFRIQITDKQRMCAFKLCRCDSQSNLFDIKPIEFLWKIWNMFGQGNFGRGDDNNHLVSWTPNTNFNECFNFDAMKMLKIKKKLRFRRHCMQMQTTNVTTLLTSNFEPVAFKIWLYVNQ